MCPGGGFGELSLRGEDAGGYCEEISLICLKGGHACHRVYCAIVGEFKEGEIFDPSGWILMNVFVLDRAVKHSSQPSFV